MLERGVEDDEQFAHTRDQDQLLRFASRRLQIDRTLKKPADQFVTSVAGGKRHRRSGFVEVRGASDVVRNRVVVTGRGSTPGPQ